MSKSLILEKFFKDYLELFKEKNGDFGLYIYYVQNEYMFINEIGEVVSKRYKTITGLMGWFYKTMKGGINYEY